MGSGILSPMDTRRRRVVALMALVAVIPVLAAVVLRGDELAVRVGAWRLRRTEPAAAPEAVKALLARGERGRRVVEAVAFVPDLAPTDTATLAVRQAALDALWKTETSSCSNERLARYLVEARGLERGNALLMLPARMRCTEVRAAALETAPTDPDEAGGSATCGLLFGIAPGDPEARTAISRAALSNPRSATRLLAASWLAETKDPGRVPVLRQLLADPVEEVRTTGACALARFYGDPAGVPILVAGMREAANNTQAVNAAHALTVIRDKRAMLALARSFCSEDFALRHASHDARDRKRKKKGSWASGPGEPGATTSMQPSST